MYALRYHIISISPLLFTANTGDPNMVATLDYIPATSIKGMLAQQYIKKKGLNNSAHKDEKFYRWFLLGELKITNAYITVRKGDRFFRLLPVPQCFQKEKGEGAVGYNLFFQEDFPVKTVAVDGYGLFEDDSLTKTSVKKTLNFHHCRDRKKGVSKEGLIFNYESIKEGQVFEGFIIGDNVTLKEFIEIVNDGEYFLGRSKNNQYGKIKFEIVSKQAEEFSSETAYHIPSSTDEILLVLTSDTIIYNENGFSTTDISEFEKTIGCKVKNAFIRQIDFECFSSIWRLKIPSETCFKAGSSFLLEIEGRDLERLLDLQKIGIGMRTHEGFGRFVIGLPSHEKIYIKDEISHEPLRPKDDVPLDVRSLLTSIVKDQFMKHIQNEAIKAAEDFSRDPRRLPPKSLLAKLESLVRDGRLTEFLRPNNIKDIARNNLERCVNRQGITLLHYLSTYTVDIERILNDRQDIRNLCKEINYEAGKIESDLRIELTGKFLMSFLSTMRKLAKLGG